jgi:dCMP deaminase
MESAMAMSKPTADQKMPDKWSKRFLKLAKAIASWSKDPNTQVGAVAVGPAREVLETGYNGLPRCVDDLPERMERPAKYLWTSHAEANLVAAAARPRLLGSTVYVTHLCCASCARSLINAGVAKIVVGDGTTSMPEDEFEVAQIMLAEAGVQLEKLESTHE